MIVLSLDTSTTACSAALLEGGRVLASRSEPMARGHQERLASLVQELMTEAKLAFAQLDRVGVTVGPGSFTGLRVGMAFAKGLAVALNIPVVGVGTLEALAATMAGVPPHAPAAGADVAVIDARRDQVYLQAFREGQALIDPQALAIADAVAAVRRLGELRMSGSGAAMMAPHLPGAAVMKIETPDPVVVARLAAAGVEPQPMRPLYLRAPDAKLPL